MMTGKWWWKNRIFGQHWQDGSQTNRSDQHVTNILSTAPTLTDSSIITEKKTEFTNGPQT